MNPKTLQTLFWGSLICLLSGMLVMSPSAALLFYSLAAIFAAFPAVFGKMWLRLAAVTVIGVSLLLAFESYPKFINENKAYRTRASEKPAK